MFLAIRELVNTWNLGTDLKAHAERKLNSRRKSVSRPLAELREHWPQLSLALGSIQKGHTLAEMPFRITSVYFQKKNHISPTDALFIEAKRLGVLS
jgi:hypothetical protein